MHGQTGTTSNSGWGWVTIPKDYNLLMTCGGETAKKYVFLSLSLSLSLHLSLSPLSLLSLLCHPAESVTTGIKSKLNLILIRLIEHPDLKVGAVFDLEEGRGVKD